MKQRLGLFLVALVTSIARATQADTAPPEAPPRAELSRWVVLERRERTADALAAAGASALTTTLGARELLDAPAHGSGGALLWRDQREGLALLTIGGGLLGISLWEAFTPGPLERLDAQTTYPTDRELLDRWKAIAQRARAARLGMGWTFTATGTALGALAFAAGAARHGGTPGPVLLGVSSLALALDGLVTLALPNAAERGWKAIAPDVTRVRPGVAPCAGGASLTVRFDL